MKKVLTVLATALVISAVLVTSLGVTVLAEEEYTHPYGNDSTPAPNSGDGIPDGSGFEDDPGNGEGPPPGSGDCEPNDIGY